MFVLALKVMYALNWELEYPVITNHVVFNLVKLMPFDWHLKNVSEFLLCICEKERATTFSFVTFYFSFAFLLYVFIELPLNELFF